METQWICHHQNEMAAAAQALIQKFPNQRLFAFYGTMGAGKTTFIQFICKYLGVTDIVNSPTFSLVNEYQTDHGESIYHFDFYRIEKLEEVYDMGYEEYFYSGNYCFMEWPEKINSLLPDELIRINIEVDAEDDSRHIRF